MIPRIIANTGRAGPGTTDSMDSTGADLLVAVFANRTTVNVAPVDSRGNTWYPMSPVAAFDGFTLEFWIVAQPSVGPDHTFNTGNGSSQPSICVMAFAGLHQTPIDRDESITPITPTRDWCLLVSGCSCPGFDDPSAVDSPFILTNHFQAVIDTSMGVGAAYYVQDIAAEVDPIGKWTVGATNAEAIAAFKPRDNIVFDNVIRQRVLIS